MAQLPIAFDLNGTLLDLSVLDEHFDRIFAAPGYREKWFQQLQVLWMTTIACRTFEPFDQLAKASLEMLAAKEGIEVSSADQKAVTERMTELPAYPEVAAALDRLKAAGHRLVALTNGGLTSAKAQVKYAGIEHAFDVVFAADQVQRYKPACDPYYYAARHLDLKPKELLLVAAHAWDIEGAARAGLQTAFVRRPRQVLSPTGKSPDYQVSDLAELAEKLG